MNKVLQFIMLVGAMLMGLVANAQAFVVATLPADITTLVTDANTLRDNVIASKVVILGAVLGFAFVGWLVSRRR